MELICSGIKNFKVGLSPVGKMYVVSALLHNARCFFMKHLLQNILSANYHLLKNILYKV